MLQMPLPHFPKHDSTQKRRFTPLIYFYGKLPSEQSDSLGLFEITFGGKV